MGLVQEAIAAGADSEIFLRAASGPTTSGRSYGEPSGRTACSGAPAPRSWRASGKQTRIHDEVSVRRPGWIGRQPVRSSGSGSEATRRASIHGDGEQARPCRRPGLPAAIQRPSGDQSGAPWMSMEAARVCEPWPSWFMTARCRRPASLTTTATRLPSGAGAGVSARCPSAPLVISNDVRLEAPQPVARPACRQEKQERRLGAARVTRRQRPFGLDAEAARRRPHRPVCRRESARSRARGGVRPRGDQRPAVTAGGDRRVLIDARRDPPWDHPIDSPPLSDQSRRSEAPDIQGPEPRSGPILLGRDEDERVLIEHRQEGHARCSGTSVVPAIRPRVESARCPFRCSGGSSRARCR